MYSKYTIFTRGRICPGEQDWMIGELVAANSFGYTLRDSRGGEYIFPAGSVEKLKKHHG